MKKAITLSITLLIPLIAAVLVGIYSYNRYDSGTSMSKQGFYESYVNKAGDNVEEQFTKYLEFYSYKYDKDPVFSEDITDKSGNPLCTFSIYKYITREENTIDDDIEFDYYVNYYYLIYNVNYKNMKDFFNYLEGSAAEKLDIPYFSLEAKLNAIEERYEEQEQKDIKNFGKSDYIIDKDAVLFAADAKDKKYTVLMSNNLTRFNIFDGTIEIKFYLKAAMEDNSEPVGKEVASFDLILDNTYDKNEELSLGYERDNKAAGYFSWVFSRYIWWQSAIAFVLIGLVTFSFYVVWTIDTDEKGKVKVNNLNKKRTK